MGGKKEAFEAALQVIQCRDVGRSTNPGEGAISNVVGIICPPCFEDELICQNLGGGAGPPTPTVLKRLVHKSLRKEKDTQLAKVTIVA